MALQELHGWLGCHNMVSSHAKAHGISYTYMAYTRPDQYYVKPIPHPSEMVPDALYVAGALSNAVAESLVVGSYQKVMVFLGTLRFMLKGSIVPGPHGFMAKTMKVAPTPNNTGSCLGCLVSANLRLLHGIRVNCLNPEQPGRYPGFCPMRQYAGPLPLTFPHARIRPGGNPTSDCRVMGIPADTPFCSLPVQADTAL
eukprot:CAMPEP_0181173702 /NCGR_PEP_ID=MMETSP1096-20121128/3142_1 /TAXON_ID=156174 ORGANISM="Chrysochromulina ericina, Strain CCMP281" /NCGR_SAMPLE_ID=MMETSP1096 /ASSEMBLY_ACC=CAM_ASM_000453 /LENGTH=197 /DNA_ID=CAMNT_0023261551 /DNA_START=1 /DNA_END=594 /DNA_ORIENTATION=+